MKKIILCLSFLMLILCACSLNDKKVVDTDTINTSTEKLDSEETSIANPASENCEKVGGSLTIETRGDGGQYGLCNFDDNRSCEEWSLLRGDCPVGGVKTTGFDTIDQKYCAWIGGSTLAVKNSICTFNDGSVCGTADLYNGLCQKGDNTID